MNKWKKSTYYKKDETLDRCSLNVQNFTDTEQLAVG